MGNLTHTVSGDIASFRSAACVPIESLKCHFLPVQEGTGDPSPDNVRPISGWNNITAYKTRKNLVHIVGWSALTTNSTNAARTLSNTYGTTINTTDFIGKTGTLNIIQSQTTRPEQINHYGNGYFVAVLDNLKFEKTYTVSFKISNIINNPLEALLSDLSIGNPYGNRYYTSQIINDRVIFHNYIFKQNADRPERSYIDIRNCGMSFTISEFMVTEEGISNQEWEPYYGEMIPITFPDTLYGGYVDITTGEVWQTIKYYTFNGEESITDYSSGITGGKRLVSVVFDDCQGNVKYIYCDKAIVETSVQYQISHLGIRIGGGQGRFYFFVPDSMFDGEVTIDKFKQWLSENSLTATALLITPELVGKLTPIELKTFLNYNNIWSNTNDITEVSYQIHDSNMIKEVKNVMAAANNSHYKKVIWNQWCYPLNADNWAGHTNDRVSVSFNDGVATSTWLTTDIGYSTSVRLNYNIAPSQITNDIWYGSYLVNPSKAGLKWGIEMCGGQQLTDDIVKPANEWSFCSFIAPVKRNNRNTIYISNVKTTNGADIGMTAQTKAPIHINLTQMFGAGNEPTKAEFEHLCSLNNIDLTIYHPYDEGTEQYWIFP